jgi:hypothetical protein
LSHLRNCACSHEVPAFWAPMTRNDNSNDEDEDEDEDE